LPRRLWRRKIELVSHAFFDDSAMNLRTLHVANAARRAPFGAPMPVSPIAWKGGAVIDQAVLQLLK